ncbi:MAG: 4Fe-4S dicluster domain-containing protein [Armatimonadetes bacterium]|nr:4Fe-4S dicluster domain-containing protein [Armatimonadota bacterium]
MPLVTTIKERCRVCYTCVRECPAKAIRITDGQAEVIPERCIGCGNCVRVCSQSAKRVMSSAERVGEVLGSGARTAAIIAPSFPAEFTDLDHRQLVGMVRALGFEIVSEVGFGADLVAQAFRELLQTTNGRRYIATSCPALVCYVERYHADLVPCLAPIVSPMVAMARVVHGLHGADVKVVFIGPCIAKKGEVASEKLLGEVEAALTFIELRELFAAYGVTPETVEPSEFDPPHAGAGALFSISRGMLQAAEISEDLVTGDVVAADGRSSFVEAIKEFETGDLDAKLLEVLCCHGCVTGSGISSDAPLFSRRSSVSRYVRQRLRTVAEDVWQQEMQRFAGVDLSRAFEAEPRLMAEPSGDELAYILARMGKVQPDDELNCGACGYETCREHASAIHLGLAESEMCLPYTIEELRRTLKELASTQEALMHSEKLASMGQLAAGIAHELNNPLGVVLMYTHILLDEAPKNAGATEDLRLIAEEADRCRKIVSGLLNFARQSKVIMQPTNTCELVSRCLQTSPAPANVEVDLRCDLDNPVASLDPNQITQVLTNLVTNACAAMPDGGTLTVRCEGDETHVRISVTDTGVGIPQDHLGKIFEPFFTTKETGKGTGLGLAVTYGIVKMHRGDVNVASNADPNAGPTGTTFAVTLPRNGRRSFENIE